MGSSTCDIKCIMMALASGGRVAVPVDDILSVVDSPVIAVPPCIDRGIAGTVVVMTEDGDQTRVPVVRLGDSVGPCVVMRCAGKSWAIQVARTERVVSVRPSASAGDWFIHGHTPDGIVRIIDVIALAASFGSPDD